jgi:hypothetical protein
MPEDARFCENCGSDLKSLAQAAPPVHPQVPAEPAAPQPQQAYSAYTAPPPPPPIQSVYGPVQPQGVPYQADYSAGNRNAPMSIGAYIGTFLLLAIPIVNFILLLVWSFSSSVNRNKKNLAITILIFWLIGIALSIVLSSLMVEFFAKNFNDISSFFEGWSYR